MFLQKLGETENNPYGPGDYLTKSLLLVKWVYRGAQGAEPSILGASYCPLP